MWLYIVTTMFINCSVKWSKLTLSCSNQSQSFSPCFPSVFFSRKINLEEAKNQAGQGVSRTCRACICQFPHIAANMAGGANWGQCQQKCKIYNLRAHRCKPLYRTGIWGLGEYGHPSQEMLLRSQLLTLQLKPWKAQCYAGSFEAVISRQEQISKHTKIYNTEGPRNCKLFKCIAETFNWNPLPGSEQINKQTEGHSQERVSTSTLRILKIIKIRGIWSKISM